jgi:hypothetical protein
MKHKLKPTLAVLAFNLIAIPAILSCSKNGFYEFSGIIAVVAIYADILFLNDLRKNND